MSDGDALSNSSLGVMNGTSEVYKNIPCTVGFAYIRFEVDGNVRPCCIAKHPIGSLSEQTDWRNIWRSAAYQSFRAKMSRIHIDKFHLTEPEFLFCQQCSHLLMNTQNAKAVAKAKTDRAAK